jgi:hypothetical protein
MKSQLLTVLTVAGVLGTATAALAVNTDTLANIDSVAADVAPVASGAPVATPSLTPVATSAPTTPPAADPEAVLPDVPDAGALSTSPVSQQSYGVAAPAPAPAPVDATSGGSGATSGAYDDEEDHESDGEHESDEGENDD